MSAALIQGESILSKLSAGFSHQGAPFPTCHTLLSHTAATQVERKLIIPQKQDETRSAHTDRKSTCDGARNDIIREIRPGCV